MPARALVVILLALTMVGCPRDVDEPLPTAGEPCGDYLDCVPVGEEACGELLNCTDGVCEESPSLTLPCP